LGVTPSTPEPAGAASAVGDAANPPTTSLLLLLLLLLLTASAARLLGREHHLMLDDARYGTKPVTLTHWHIATTAQNDRFAILLKLNRVALELDRLRGAKSQ